MLSRTLTRQRWRFSLPAPTRPSMPMFEERYKGISFRSP